MSCWGKIKPESEFYAVFKDENVPIKSIVPIIPRGEGYPPCYVVLCKELSKVQKAVLATMLLDKWYPECFGIDQAMEYCSHELPLQTTHFDGVSTDDYFYLPHGVVMAAIVLGQGEHSEDVG